MTISKDQRKKNRVFLPVAFALSDYPMENSIHFKRASDI